MKQKRTLRRLAAGLLLAAMAFFAALPAAAEIPVRAVDVTYADTLLFPGQSRLIGSTTYVPLRAFCAELGEEAMTWDAAARTATLSADGLTLTAAVGAEWIEANGRCFWAPDGVRLVEGTMMVPVRPLARAFGLEGTWDADTASVRRTESGEGYAAPADAVYDPTDLYWLSRIISAECKGESLEGQIAVGNVVLNRVESEEFPDTIPGVIFDTVDGVQFEPVENGTVYHTPTEQSVEAARRTLDGEETIGDALYFYAPALSQGVWINANRTYYDTIGCHRFYL